VLVFSLTPSFSRLKPGDRVRLRARGRNILCRPYSVVAPHYDRLTGWADFRKTRRAFEFLVKYYGLQFRSAVDIGCGTGLFACYLNRRWGTSVFAVDRSPEMLAVASLRCNSPNVTYLCQDVMDLCLPCAVDLATANTFTVNHMMTGSAMQRVFRRIRDHLVPGGHFVFDLLTDRQSPRLVHEQRRLSGAPGEVILHRIRWNPTRRTLSIVIVQNSPTNAAPVAESYVGRGYSLLEVGECLLRSGFKVRGIHDKSTLGAPSGNSSQVLIVAARV
jgi:SAM-dependent methyltransferase